MGPRRGGFWRSGLLTRSQLLHQVLPNGSDGLDSKALLAAVLSALPKLPSPTGLLQQRNAVIRQLLIAAGKQAASALQNGLQQGVAARRHHGDAAGVELSGTQAEGFITATGVDHPNGDLIKSVVTLQAAAAFKGDPIAIAAPLQQGQAVPFVGTQTG